MKQEELELLKMLKQARIRMLEKIDEDDEFRDELWHDVHMVTDLISTLLGRAY